MSENYEIDFAVGYTFELLERLVGDCVSRENLTVDEYIKKIENDHVSEVDAIFDAIILSTVIEEIRISIGQLLDSKCEWNCIERSGYERNNL